VTPTEGPRNFPDRLENFRVAKYSAVASLIALYRHISRTHAADSTQHQDRP
jgi:hypothetical protein